MSLPVTLQSFSMKLLSLLCVVFVSLLSPDGASAGTIWQRCDNCNPQVSTSMAEQSGPFNDIVIYDPALSTALAFLTTETAVGENCHPRSLADARASRHSAGCQYVTVASLRELSAPEIQLMTSLGEFYDYTSGQMKTRITVSSDDFIGLTQPGLFAGDPQGWTAHDVRNSANVEGIVRAATVEYMNNINAIRNVFAALRQGLEIIFFGADMTVTFRIVFGDGSYILLRAHPDSPLPEVGEAVDSRGVTVMTSDNTGRFIGDNDFPDLRDAQNWLNNAAALGIPIIVNGNVPSGFVRVDCILRNGQVSCESPIPPVQN